MSQRNRQAPSDWDAYERGRASSTGSLHSINEDPTARSTGSSPILVTRTQNGRDGAHSLGERRSSMFFNSIRQMGGVNNIDNFARSFQRAAGFREITPIRRGSVSYGDGEEGRRLSRSPSTPSKSLIRQQLESGQHQPPNATTEDSRSRTEPRVSLSEEQTPLLHPYHTLGTGHSRSSGSHFLTDNSSVLGTSYGSISSRLTAAAQRRASILIQQQHEASIRAREDPDEYKDSDERQVETETREDGEVVERLVGESTVPMTVFNSTNVLIGVGILALPLAMKYAGWVIGLTFLALAALATNYTAKLLAKCLDSNTASTTYGDLAYLAFDDWGRAIVEILFVVELLAANVALIILFGDSMHILLPSISIATWKITLALGLLPLNFLPMKALSMTSVLGIMCCLGIILIVLVDGLIKPWSPGSLREVATTYAFPANWRTLPLSFGLIMAPWGGHSVFPAIYKDMRHPRKYHKALTMTYICTFGLDTTLAVLGYLMFGDGVKDEITSNLLTSQGYPKLLSIIAVVLIALIPITKIPLTNRPIQDTMNKKFMIDLRQMDLKARQYSQHSIKHRIGRAAISIISNLVQLGIAILIPGFDSVMALLGSMFCFTICIIGPVSFYLKIFSTEGKEISVTERVFDWILIIVCVVLGATGTAFAFIPKEQIGAQVCQGFFACL